MEVLVVWDDMAGMESIRASLKIGGLVHRD